jgi:hypothetical protein
MPLRNRDAGQEQGSRRGPDPGWGRGLPPGIDRRRPTRRGGIGAGDGGDPDVGGIGGGGRGPREARVGRLGGLARVAADDAGAVDPEGAGGPVVGHVLARDPLHLPDGPRRLVALAADDLDRWRQMTETTCGRGSAGAAPGRSALAAPGGRTNATGRSRIASITWQATESSSWVAWTSAKNRARAGPGRLRSSGGRPWNSIRSFQVMTRGPLADRAACRPWPSARRPGPEGRPRPRASRRPGGPSGSPGSARRGPGPRRSRRPGRGRGSGPGS